MSNTDDKDSTVNQCVACLGDLRFWGKRLGYTYKACKKCGGLQLDPIPEKTELQRLYRFEYSEHSDFGYETAALHVPIYLFLIELLKSLKPISDWKLIVDLGCGWGGLCQLLDENDLQYIGVDYSEIEINSCQERELNCHAGDLGTIKEKKLLADAIISVFVFEHLIDYPSFFKDCDKILNQEGRVILVIPTSSFVKILGDIFRRFRKHKDMPQFGECISPPWHTTIFSPQGVEAICRSNNFKVEQVLHCPKYKGETLLKKIIKFGLLWIEKIGIKIFGSSWPIATAHIFVIGRDTDAI